MKKQIVKLLLTAPSMVLSSFTIAWAVEMAQFFISQSLALALLALLQTLPEFLVEANLAWNVDLPDLTSNITGSVRLITGLGIPLVFLVANFRKGFSQKIRLRRQHSLVVMSLLLTILVFLPVMIGKSIKLSFSVVLFGIYLFYFWKLFKIPAEDYYRLEEFGKIAAKLRKMDRRKAGFFVFTALFLGGTLLFIIIGPFMESLKAIAFHIGISSYVFIQWIAPFLSELPEGVSALYLARRREFASMGIINLISSNLFQLTVIAGALPVIVSLASGKLASVPLNYLQQQELSLTIVQFAFVVTILLKMEIDLWEILSLLLLWTITFFYPAARSFITNVFGFLTLFELFLFVVGKTEIKAYKEFLLLIKREGVKIEALLHR